MYAATWRRWKPAECAAERGGAVRDYNTMLECPQEHAERVNDFLDERLAVEKMGDRSEPDRQSRPDIKRCLRRDYASGRTRLLRFSCNDDLKDEMGWLYVPDDCKMPVIFCEDDGDGTRGGMDCPPPTSNLAGKPPVALPRMASSQPSSGGRKARRKFI
jgi:hypothetical protein